jgi:type II secretory pathway pseudopilin PulG
VLRKNKAGGMLILAMLAMLAISGISVAVYSIAKSSQQKASAIVNSTGVKSRAINAAQFAIDNLKLTPSQSLTPPPSCNSTNTCQALPQADGRIAFAWQQGVLASIFGSTPKLVNDEEPLSFWQTYAYSIPGTTTDYVLVQINGGNNATGYLYNITGYSNVNGNIATYTTSYSWLAS